MNKISKILELMNGDPTLWETYSYEKEWTDAELNLMLENEALLKIPELSLELQRPEAALIAKYFELRSDLDGKVVLDVQIISSDLISWSDFTSLEYTLDDLYNDVTVINAKVGDYVRVNVRTLIPYPPETDVALGFSTSGAIQGISATANKTDPDYWAFACAEIVATGTCSIGTQITGLKKMVLFVVEE